MDQKETAPPQVLYLLGVKFAPLNLEPPKPVGPLAVCCYEPQLPLPSEFLPAPRHNWIFGWYQIVPELGLQAIAWTACPEYQFEQLTGFLDANKADLLNTLRNYRDHQVKTLKQEKNSEF